MKVTKRMQRDKKTLKRNYFTYLKYKIIGWNNKKWQIKERMKDPHQILIQCSPVEGFSFNTR